MSKLNKVAQHQPSVQQIVQNPMGTITDMVGGTVNDAVHADPKGNPNSDSPAMRLDDLAHRMQEARSQAAALGVDPKYANALFTALQNKEISIQPEQIPDLLNKTLSIARSSGVNVDEVLTVAVGLMIRHRLAMPHVLQMLEMLRYQQMRLPIQQGGVFTIAALAATGGNWQPYWQRLQMALASPELNNGQINFGSQEILDLEQIFAQLGVANDGMGKMVDDFEKHYLHRQQGEFNAFLSHITSQMPFINSRLEYINKFQKDLGDKLPGIAKNPIGKGIIQMLHALGTIFAVGNSWRDTAFGGAGQGGGPQYAPTYTGRKSITALDRIITAQTAPTPPPAPPAPGTTAPNPVANTGTALNNVTNTQGNLAAGQGGMNQNDPRIIAVVAAQNKFRQYWQVASQNYEVFSREYANLKMQIGSLAQGQNRFNSSPNEGTAGPNIDAKNIRPEAERMDQMLDELLKLCLATKQTWDEYDATARAQMGKPAMQLEAEVQQGQGMINLYQAGTTSAVDNLIQKIVIGKRAVLDLMIFGESEVEIYQAQQRLSALERSIKFSQQFMGGMGSYQYVMNASGLYYQIANLHTKAANKYKMIATRSSDPDFKTYAQSLYNEHMDAAKEAQMTGSQTMLNMALGQGGAGGEAMSLGNSLAMKRNKFIKVATENTEVEASEGSDTMGDYFDELYKNTDVPGAGEPLRNPQEHRNELVEHIKPHSKKKFRPIV